MRSPGNKMTTRPRYANQKIKFASPYLKMDENARVCGNKTVKIPIISMQSLLLGNENFPTSNRFQIGQMHGLSYRFTLMSTKSTPRHFWFITSG